MPFAPGTKNPAKSRVKKSSKMKEYSRVNAQKRKTLVVLRKTSSDKDIGAGYGLFAPGKLIESRTRAGQLSVGLPKVAIKKGDTVTGLAGRFASAKDPNTSRFYTAPAGDLGHADGGYIRELVVKALDGLTEVQVTASSKFKPPASASSRFYVLWDMLGVFLNSSHKTGVEANVSNPCKEKATAFHIESIVEEAVDGRRFSRRLRGGEEFPESFIVMPMIALRDIMEGEQLMWEYPWK